MSIWTSHKTKRKKKFLCCWSWWFQRAMALLGCTRCLATATKRQQQRLLFPLTSLQRSDFLSSTPGPGPALVPPFLSRRSFAASSSPHRRASLVVPPKLPKLPASPDVIVKTAGLGIPYALLRSGDEAVEFDAGKATLPELADMSGARMRDLRALKPSIPIRSSLIVVRDKSILVIVDPMKVVIYHDRIQFFHTEHPAVRSYLRDFFIARMSKTKAQTFELKAMECLLITALRQMDRELEKQSQPTTKELVNALQSVKTKRPTTLQRTAWTARSRSISYHVQGRKQFLQRKWEKVPLTSGRGNMSRDVISQTSRARPLKRPKSDHTEV